LGGFYQVVDEDFDGDYGDVLERAARNGRLAEAGGEVVAAASEDSWAAFVRRGMARHLDMDQLTTAQQAARLRRIAAAKAANQSRQAEAQAEWEAERRAARERVEAAAEAAWRHEEERRRATRDAEQAWHRRQDTHIGGIVWPTDPGWRKTF
jgi:hypothetical protein